MRSIPPDLHRPPAALTTVQPAAVVHARGAAEAGHLANAQVPQLRLA
jgi:hypothetical protein